MEEGHEKSAVAKGEVRERESEACQQYEQDYC